MTRPSLNPRKSPMIKNLKHPAMAVSIAALALTGSGGAFAATSLTSGTQIANNSISASKLTPAARTLLMEHVAGPAGPAGPTGPAGPQGAVGRQGALGDQGVPGPQGAPGPTGPQGAQGQTGPQGAPGATGPAGPVGAQGQTGAQGATGPAGADSAASTTIVQNSTTATSAGWTSIATPACPGVVVSGGYKVSDPSGGDYMDDGYPSGDAWVADFWLANNGDTATVYAICQS